MNCIICADKICCKLLEEFVGKFTSLNLLGTFTDSLSVMEQLSKEQNTDLVFLDIEILKKADFDIISSSDFKPKVILISSSDQNALKAFDLNVVDYLIKPVSYSRFCKAVDKSIRYHSRENVSNSIDNEIFIKKGSALVKLKYKDIIYIEALENYVTLNTTKDKFTIHFTLKAIENQLPSNIFIRIHRSFIINKNLIQAISENSLELILGDSLKSFQVGKSFMDSLMNKLNMLTN